MSNQPKHTKELILDNLPEASTRIEQSCKTGATELDLSRLGLAELPEAIGQLTQLKVLGLTNNQLTALPEAIGQLTQLRRLFLDGNELTALPGSLRNLKSLMGLFLDGNDALGLPAEVLGLEWKNVDHGVAEPAKPSDILNYYFRLRGGKRPLNEAKLILVGRGAVGKTSIVNRLVQNRFDPNETKTEGINIIEWKIQLNEKEVSPLVRSHMET